MLVGSAQAQQFPNPRTPPRCQVQRRATAMTTDYVQMVGRMAYLWGWPLVDSVDRAAVFVEGADPGLVGGVVPIANRAVLPC